jgi:arabinan endo-1,5-alpha-L-arabinosidase
LNGQFFAEPFATEFGHNQPAMRGAFLVFGLCATLSLAACGSKGSQAPPPTGRGGASGHGGSSAGSGGSSAGTGGSNAGTGGNTLSDGGAGNADSGSGGAGGTTPTCTGCAANQVCVSGVCQDVPQQCPCPKESYCDLAVNRCVVGCTSDDLCDTGRICDTTARQCQAGCRTDAQCGAGLVCVAMACTTPAVDAGPPTTYTTMGHQGVQGEDPSIGIENGRYYMFLTGTWILGRSSTNRINWNSAAGPFSQLPAWIAPVVGFSPTFLRGPDVSFFGGQWCLYYSATNPGQNASAIGLATRATLAAGSTWVDQGEVLHSSSAVDWNAVDPNVAFDGQGNPWLAFGSFFSGIKLRRLDPATGKLSTADTQLYSIAAGPGMTYAMETPSIMLRDGFYYLFVTSNVCCNPGSTSRIVMGRATEITGPYADLSGVSMMQGGGTEMLATDGRQVGPGIGTAYRDGTSFWYVYSYYDSMDGTQEIGIRVINWSVDGWPSFGPPLWF